MSLCHLFVCVLPFVQSTDTRPLCLQLDMKVSDKEVKSDREVKHVTEQSVESLIDAFQQHAELMCQLSRLVAAGSLHSKSTPLSCLSCTLSACCQC